MKRASRAKACGSTLLEVAIALGIMAMCGLGLINTQLGLARQAQLAAARERAAFVADAWAEASRMAGAAGSAAGERWKALAASIVPEGQLAANGASGDASVASVNWTATPFSASSNASANTGTNANANANANSNGNASPRAASCASAAVAAGRDCIAVAFLR
ncbi:hypothetical protein [Paraburkholderia sp. J41]|uniref:hypothetical protein n=1 Tax=Paraburkholderia sp. J41 TaxID=2805433 RepID=UPI002AC32FDA|nr:hypothetical protein [Paraburkholderia sp. J41]